MSYFTVSNIAITLFLVILSALFLVFLNYITQQKLNKKKTEFSNNAGCRQALKAHRRRLYTDYFWSDYMRFAWVMLILTLLIGICLAIAHLITFIIALFLAVLGYFFIRFSMKSYKEFEEKAKTRLSQFESEVEADIRNEISFKGDNIQIFSEGDSGFDTNPLIFSFPTKVSKIAFPPLEKNAKKHSIVSTRKLEFLILSREYFSICKNASTFNLLEPDRAGPPKKCAELPGKGGECHEHYYSQMRNVEYDNKEECIRIIYYDERDDVEFPCKKMAPNRKPAMKALQEKLRLTERQKLKKIDEHEKYEKIMRRREENSNSDDEEPKES